MNHGKKNAQGDGKDLQDEYDFEDDEDDEVADPMQLELDIDDVENNTKFQLDMDANAMDLDINAPELEERCWKIVKLNSIILRTLHFKKKKKLLWYW